MAAARVEARKQAAKAVAKEEKPMPRVNSLVRALENPDKGVRYGAAGALARIKPVGDFPGSQAVVEILGQAITEQGVSTVLIVTEDAQAANRLRVLAREGGHVPYSAGSTATALAGSRSLPPKDLILLDDQMDEVFKSLKKDPAVAGIPVVVFTKDKDMTVAQQAYPGVSVVSLADTADAVKSEVSRVILGKRTPGEGTRLAAQYAALGARALASIPARGSPFSPHLARIKPALIAALDSTMPAVRISAVGALGKARIKSLIPRLILVCEAEDRPQAERLACIEAIGDMLDPTAPAPAEVVALLERIHRSGNDALRRFANERLSSVSIPPGGLEELINAEEAAESKEAPGDS